MYSSACNTPRGILNERREQRVEATCGYTGVCLDPVLADGIQPSLIRLTFQSHFSLWLKRILLIINGTEKDIVTT